MGHLSLLLCLALVGAASALYMDYRVGSGIYDVTGASFFSLFFVLLFV